MQLGATPLLALAAAAAFTAAASSHLPLGLALRFATLAPSAHAGRALVLFPLVLGAALLHERLVRGALYGALGRRLGTGFAAPAAAALGALFPAALRLSLFESPRVLFAVVAGHAYVVEALLGLGLCWLALGTGTTAGAGVALSLVWLARLTVTATFHGGALPLLEVLAAALAAAAAALVLARPLKPHRDALMGVS